MRTLTRPSRLVPQRLGGRQPPYPAPSRADVAVGGSVCLSHGHRRTPAPSGWHAASRSGTRALQNGGGVPTTRRVTAGAGYAGSSQGRRSRPNAWVLRGPRPYYSITIEVMDKAA